jgi:hypothetical protein
MILLDSIYAVYLIKRVYIGEKSMLGKKIGIISLISTRYQGVLMKPLYPPLLHPYSPLVSAPVRPPTPHLVEKGA